MDALHLLENRVSVPLQMDPAPTPGQLRHIMSAALRAPDHGRLRPWRFLLIEGDARHRLGQLFVDAALAERQDISAETQARFAGMPLRAPLMIVAIARLRENCKIPRDEQLVACGCAVDNMMLAAHAQGLAAMWRTGKMAYDPIVRSGLSLAENEVIAAFLYLGTPAALPKPTPRLDPDEFFQRW